MNKKYFSIVLLICLSISLLSVNADMPNKQIVDNTIYEDHYTLDLSNINISTQNDSINLISQKTDKNIENTINTLKVMLKDKQFEKDLKEMIKKNQTPFRIGIAEAYFIKTVDENGIEIYSRPMTKSEVKELKNNNFILPQTMGVNYQGQTQTWNKLSLYTTVSGTKPNYWVQSNAYWQGSASISSGPDFIGITWPTCFIALNDSKFTGYYEGGLPIGQYSLTSPSEPSEGLNWQFTDTGTLGNGTFGTQSAYAGVTAQKQTSTSETLGIRSTYVHTYTDYNFSLSIELSSEGVAGQVTVQPDEGYWTLTSYVSGLL